MIILLTILGWIGKALVWFLCFELFLTFIFVIYCLLLLGFDELRKVIERYRWDNETFR